MLAMFTAIYQYLTTYIQQPRYLSMQRTVIRTRWLILHGHCPVHSIIIASYVRTLTRNIISCNDLGKRKHVSAKDMYIVKI